MLMPYQFLVLHVLCDQENSDKKLRFEPQLWNRKSC